MKIAIQGIIGSNHHIVAENYFGKNINLQECLSFDSLADSSMNSESDYEVMTKDFKILGEYKNKLL